MKGMARVLSSALNVKSQHRLVLVGTTKPGLVNENSRICTIHFMVIFDNPKVGSRLVKMMLSD